MTTEQLPAFGATRAPTPAPRSMLARAVARPSLPALVGLGVVVAFFGLQSPGLFGAGGLAGILDVAATLGVGGVAVALLMIAGQFDLSVAAVAAGSSLLAALLIQDAGWGVWPALLAALAGALLVGLVNGVLTVATGVPGFLTTLASFLLLEGATLALAQRLAGSTAIGGLQSAPGWGSASVAFAGTAALGGGHFRISLLWWLAVTAAASRALWRTRFGNAVFAIGGARRAARQLGVPVAATTVALFCLTAIAGWLIGAFALLRTGGVPVSPGLGLEIDLVVVAVIGGCLLTGGYGSTAGAALASLLFAVAQEGMLRAGWDPRWFQTLLGVLLLVALGANGLVRRRLKAVPRS